MTRFLRECQTFGKEFLRDQHTEGRIGQISTPEQRRLWVSTQPCIINVADVSNNETEWISARTQEMLPVWAKTHDLSHNLKQVFFVLRDWSWTTKTSQAVWHCSAMLDRASSRGTAPRNNDALRMHWISRWDLLVNPKEVAEHKHKGPVWGRTQFISTDVGNTDFSMLWTLQYQLTENSRQYVT